ncbi:MAG: hydrolase [Clostridiales bacterium]|jgi:hypothetical protein|nr:hydrolase [Clostridiales bacterium]
MRQLIEAAQKEFLSIFDEHIKREGAAALREYLLTKSDFFSAPASAKFHSAFAGGLCAHSVNVYNKLVSLLAAQFGETWREKYAPESVAVCGLLHDICKVDCYRPDKRNVKVDGKWEERPYFARDEKLPYGHGEKSVYILSGFMKLTREEAMSINWHMGGFDSRVRGGDNSVSEAYRLYLLAPLLHASDLLATYLDEESGE